MKVKKIGKPRENSHSLDMLPVPRVVGALPSLETAPSSSQPMLAVEHNPLHSLSSSPGRVITYPGSRA